MVSRGYVVCAGLAKEGHSFEVRSKSMAENRLAELAKDKPGKER